MRYIKQRFHETDSELEDWHRLLGGILEDGVLVTSDGTIKEYRFVTHRVLVIKMILTDEISSMRTMDDAGDTIPLIFSESVTFEAKDDGSTEATPSDTLSTGIFFSNQDMLFHYPAGKEINLIMFRVPKDEFSRILPSGHPFLDRLLSGDSFRFYESIGVEMKFLMRRLLEDNTSDVLKNELAEVRSRELLLLFAEKFFFHRTGGYRKIPEAQLLALQKVKDYMLSDLSCPKTTEELVMFSGMSATRLRQAFKEVYGMNLYSMFQENRMEKACSMLIKGHMNVSEIAYSLGYSHLGHFSEEFRKRFGCHPKDFKPRNTVLF